MRNKSAVGDAGVRVDIDQYFPARGHLAFGAPHEGDPEELAWRVPRTSALIMSDVGRSAMKCSKQSFAVVPVFFVVLLSLSIGTLNARDADLASHTFAAAHTTKQQCMNTCRARYRDCRRLNQLPSFECRSVYQDCTRYTCTGLGPG